MINTIILKGIIDEDFVNYKVPSITLMFPYCDFKCGNIFCQNYSLNKDKDIEIGIDVLCKRYINNPITHAVVCQGLEPFDSFNELEFLTNHLRNIYHCCDDIVIYTGYYKEEIINKIRLLKKYPNIVIKFGRYLPDQESHFDEILGVNLASDNQYAERIS